MTKTPDSLAFLKETLQQATKFRPSDETLDLLLTNSHTHLFKRKSTIIDKGDTTPDLYILENGIARLSFYDFEGNETTYGFGSTGTIFLSPSSYYMNKPAYFIIIACTDCEMRVVKKNNLDALLLQSHDLALWMYHMAIAQFYAIEMRTEVFASSARDNLKSIINGDFKQRYINFTKNHPDIATSVPAKVLASYLGITPAYLSKIRRQIIQEERKSKKTPESP